MAGSFGKEAAGIDAAGVETAEIGTLAFIGCCGAEKTRVYSPGPLGNSGSVISGFAPGLENTWVAPDDEDARSITGARLSMTGTAGSGGATGAEGIGTLGARKESRAGSRMVCQVPPAGSDGPVDMWGSRLSGAFEVRSKSNELANSPCPSFRAPLPLPPEPGACSWFQFMGGPNVAVNSPMTFRGGDGF